MLGRYVSRSERWRLSQSTGSPLQALQSALDDRGAKINQSSPEAIEAKSGSLWAAMLSRSEKWPMVISVATVSGSDDLDVTIRAAFRRLGTEMRYQRGVDRYLISLREAVGAISIDQPRRT